MNIIPTDIPGPVIIEPQIFGDDRGFFMETFQKRIFSEAGLPTDFAQDNHSGSRKGILRGLHYQLVRVVVGEVFDVAVDLRRSSPYFGRWVGLRLSAENKRIFWVPPGFGHAFYVLSNWAEFLYKATDFYAPEHERAIAWNDPELAIPWPGGTPRVSPKDARAPRLPEAELFP